MVKITAFFLCMMLVSGLLVGIMAGGGGVTTTDLTANVTASATSLPVETTTDFLDEDSIWIGDEQIYYTSVNSTTFLGCTRGYMDSTATTHLTGARVFTRTSSALNKAAGFDVLAVQDKLGWAAFIAIPVMFIVVTLPQIMRSGTNLLTGDLAIIVYFWYAMVTAFIVTLAFSLMGARRVT